MTDTLDDSKRARDESRERLHLTLVEARDRFSPRSLGSEMLDKAKDQAMEKADLAVNAAKKRPALTAAIATGLAALLLRKPLFGAIRRLTKEKDNG